MTTIGSLCSGYGGLDMALAAALGGSVSWHVEYDDAPSKILAHRFPGVPNHGDLTTLDYDQLAPVDWLTAGYPCQPFSHAGKRKGASDERHLWPYVAAAIGALRPRGVLLENVAGHVSLGLDAVLWELASLGYDTRWGVVRASDAGAPHGRARIFIVATDADAAAQRRGRAEGQQRGVGAARLLTEPPADAAGVGRGEGRAEPAGLVGRPDAAECGVPAVPDPDRERGGQRRLAAPGEAAGGRTSAVDPGRGRAHVSADADLAGLEGAEPTRGLILPAWGAYEPAIRRWERVTGRAAPRPTEPGRVGERLSPRFVEWLMGLPDGWVTAVPGLARNVQLKALGNGVVPQQALLACQLLLPDQLAVAA